MIVDGDVSQLVDVLLAWMAPDEILGHLLRELVGIHGDEPGAALLRLQRHINRADVQSIEVHENEHIVLIDVIEVQDVWCQPHHLRGGRQCRDDVGASWKHAVDAGQAARPPEDLHRRDGRVAACAEDVDESAFKHFVRQQVSCLEDVLLLVLGNLLKKRRQFCRVLAN